VLKPKSLHLFPNLFNFNTKIKFIFQKFWSIDYFACLCIIYHKCQNLLTAMLFFLLHHLITHDYWLRVWDWQCHTKHYFVHVHNHRPLAVHEDGVRICYQKMLSQNPTIVVLHRQIWFKQLRFPNKMFFFNQFFCRSTFYSYHNSFLHSVNDSAKERAKWQSESQTN
jgi:hypothetical protein